ncbi:Predicted house-cleaning noncanonical NTP pyrophosphatase, all-alpha NTP-PPase (MazG) superfamily [Desulfonispora thiosulfatigenes DSM 11270]|uniref:Predicted house-cleaning noncanonical NTP pyrophosphatase, all-alpha NTP-PPase (MazG) superfamily n=1 Tax=Desulfonispora thiosulfatigenes DSM 11270 TaxID=656914 RepID=A0A1W1UJZ0_DESTI|nr:nucleoside triphosphate pyrophosphohydrolase [Desulfonispora thiosulfatigenes]SMB81400.1 Predicted house-cleaning noncanonical NTP pyrophosphatase, all-alpha NTP-PPase (MazG) superfamily [Desulfonispora thiosulfatigenes DSM 11270]
MIIEYKKLVRDKIPQIIENDGKKVEISKIIDDDFFRKMLVDKLKEEVNEYLESFDPEELADILEVIYALANQVHKLNMDDIEKIRQTKVLTRGSFKEGLVLEKVYSVE